VEGMKRKFEDGALTFASNRDEEREKLYRRQREKI
jgi:hypothetical protein